MWQNFQKIDDFTRLFHSTRHTLNHQLAHSIFQPNVSKCMTPLFAYLSLYIFLSSSQRTIHDFQSSQTSPFLLVLDLAGGNTVQLVLSQLVSLFIFLPFFPAQFCSRSSTEHSSRSNPRKLTSLNYPLDVSCRRRLINN